MTVFYCTAVLINKTTTEECVGILSLRKNAVVLETYHGSHRMNHCFFPHFASLKEANPYKVRTIIIST